jgi:hypothetical protein
MLRQEITELSSEDLEQAISDFYTAKYPSKKGSKFIVIKHKVSTKGTGPSEIDTVVYSATITRIIPADE